MCSGRVTLVQGGRQVVVGFRSVVAVLVLADVVVVVVVVAVFVVIFINVTADQSHGGLAMFNLERC
jgi:hypothetical protein